MKQNIPLEEHEGMYFADWLRLKKINFFHVTNENVFKPAQRKKLKRQGLHAGVQHYVVFLPSVILFIELKRRKKKLLSGKMSVSHTKTTEEQYKWRDIVNGYGYAKAEICYGWNEAVEFVEGEINKIAYKRIRNE